MIKRILVMATLGYSPLMIATELPEAIFADNRVDVSVKTKALVEWVADSVGDELMAAIIFQKLAGSYIDEDKAGELVSFSLRNIYWQFFARSVGADFSFTDNKFYMIFPVAIAAPLKWKEEHPESQRYLLNLIEGMTTLLQEKSSLIKLAVAQFSSEAVESEVKASLTSQIKNVKDKSLQEKLFADFSFRASFRKNLVKRGDKVPDKSTAAWLVDTYIALQKESAEKTLIRLSKLPENLYEISTLIDLAQLTFYDFTSYKFLEMMADDHNELRNRFINICEDKALGEKISAAAISVIKKFVVDSVGVFTDEAAIEKMKELVQKEILPLSPCRK